MSRTIPGTVKRKKNLENVTVASTRLHLLVVKENVTRKKKEQTKLIITSFSEFQSKEAHSQNRHPGSKAGTKFDGYFTFS